jgi:hypothetical protein
MDDGRQAADACRLLFLEIPLTDLPAHGIPSLQTEEARNIASAGATAYLVRRLPDANPYPPSDWRHPEWYLGWAAAEENDPARSWDWSTGSFKQLST